MSVDPASAPPSRARAVALALLVTFLWSTSWILIKVGLADLELQPIGFAGLRYALAAAILLPLSWPRLREARPWRAGPAVVAQAALLGLLLYAIAQGAQFAALDILPAATVGLVLSMSPAAVALLGIRRAHEPTGALQLAGIAVLIAGVVLYFGLQPLSGDMLVGVLVAGGGMLATAGGAHLGRHLVRDSLSDFGTILGLTAVTMTIGAVVLLGAGIALEGVPPLTATGWLIVAWLAVVNTAVAFTLWNHTLRRLTAVESSVLNNMMLVQIAVLAWVFLDEALDGRRIAGLGLVMVGVLVVQLAPTLRRRRDAAGFSDAGDGPGRASP